jgi:hypothetical protein
MTFKMMSSIAAGALVVAPVFMGSAKADEWGQENGCDFQ